MVKLNMSVVEMIQAAREYSKLLDEDKSKMYMALFHDSSTEEKSDNLSQVIEENSDTSWAKNLVHKFTVKVTRYNNNVEMVKKYVKAAFTESEEISWMIRFHKTRDKTGMLKEAETYLQYN